MKIWNSNSIIICVCLIFVFILNGVQSDDNDKDKTYLTNVRSNHTELRSSYETTFYKWFPWKRPRYMLMRQDDTGGGGPCNDQSSLEEFPEDLFTLEQRLNGAIVLHFLGAIYFFTMCGLVINNYFMPAIQCFCDDLHISSDVAAAVFMATATAVPELCTNTISIFIADSDMGLGTIIGSLVWNVLGVAALASIATTKPVRMDWLPITRDSAIFAINSLLLFGVIYDGQIHYWEAILMLVFVGFYYTIMFQNTRISSFLRRKFEYEYQCWCTKYYDDDDQEKKLDIESVSSVPDVAVNSMPATPTSVDCGELKRKVFTGIVDQEEIESPPPSLWEIPRDESRIRTWFWFYSWPIRFILTITIPNPRTYRKLYWLTFIVCIIYIGFITYFIFWMMVVIGHTFDIPESVMGLTVFAIGGNTPEMMTGFIMARRGNSAVGVAHSLGAASLAILISLGIPWLIQSLIKLNTSKPYVDVYSNGMNWTVLGLVLVIATFYICLSSTRFTLKKVTGILLISSYIIFITLAVLIEVDIFFPNDC